MSRLMSRRRVFLLSVAILAVVLAGCAGPANQVKARLGREFSMAIGQTVAVEKEPLELKFLGVTGDSRCPKNVTCIQAGQVSATVEIKDSGAPARITLTQTGLTDQSGTERFHNYELIFDVQPYPEAEKRIAPEDYHLVLTLNKAK